MDILQFTRELVDAKPEGGLHRWAEATQLALVEAVLHLAHYEDELSDEARAKYSAVLREVLDVVPDHALLGVSASLRRRLLEVASNDVKPRLHRLLGEERPAVPA